MLEYCPEKLAKDFLAAFAPRGCKEVAVYDDDEAGGVYVMLTWKGEPTPLSIYMDGEAVCITPGNLYNEDHTEEDYPERVTPIIAKVD